MFKDAQWLLPHEESFGEFAYLKPDIISLIIPILRNTYPTLYEYILELLKDSIVVLKQDKKGTYVVSDDVVALGDGIKGIHITLFNNKGLRENQIFKAG